MRLELRFARLVRRRLLLQPAIGARAALSGHSGQGAALVRERVARNTPRQSAQLGIGEGCGEGREQRTHAVEERGL